MLSHRRDEGLFVQRFVLLPKDLFKIRPFIHLRSRASVGKSKNESKLLMDRARCVESLIEVKVVPIVDEGFIESR